MDETIRRVKEYFKIIHKDTVDENLLDFIISETIDRVQLYLNSEQIPTKIERILANVVDTSLKKCLKNIELSTEVDKAISSISDNGQSVSYNNEITKYFTTASDEEIFSGFTSLLNRYRRIKVVHSTNVQ